MEKSKEWFGEVKAIRPDTGEWDLLWVGKLFSYPMPLEEVKKSVIWRIKSVARERGVEVVDWDSLEIKSSRGSV